jgi:hypothetical protein
MRYLILIYSNPASRAIWAALTDEQRASGLDDYAELTEDLLQAGELVISQRLADPSTGKRVHVRDGVTTATDGPFAEVKEHLAGVYLIDCPNMDRAVEIAARVPEAGLGLVDVRPVMDLRGPEWEM